MIIDFASFSDKGDREYNEDYIGSANIDNNFVYVLADGLGGHGKGEVASKLVADTITSLVFNKNVKDENFLDTCFVNAQKKLLIEQKNQGATDKMKTTAVVLYINDRYASYGHIGDSRLYVINKKKIVTRTLDHSVPQMLANSGRIKEKDIRHHEDRNRLVKAMGTEWDKESPKYQIDEKNLEIKEDMAFLLCSDGFWEWITEKEMQKVLKKKLSADEQLKQMVEIAYSNGRGKNMDNISAMLIKIKELD